MKILKNFREVEITVQPYAFIMESKLGLDLRKGWGNGYVAIPLHHPWYLEDQEKLEHVKVHGGITYSSAHNTMWVIGFDTSHAYSSATHWTIEKVWEETLGLLDQVEKVK